MACGPRPQHALTQAWRGTQIPKQLHITPLKPPRHKHAYPPYLNAPYLNVKDAVQHVLSTEWHVEHAGLPPASLPPTSTSDGYRMSADLKRGRKSPGFYRNIAGQLRQLGLGEFEGRAHSGIDVRSVCWPCPGRR